MARVLMILDSYPQLSQTYVQTEIDALLPEHEIRVISRRGPDLASSHHLDYVQTQSPREMRELIDAFRPHVLHTHWMQNVRLVAKLARATGTPFTVRAHSFDVLKRGTAGQEPTPFVERSVEDLADELCLGVLTFPFTRPLLEKAGVPGSRIVECFPVVDFARFHDRGPNGPAVINVGACTPKKRMEDFIELASRLPGIEFNLYAIGYRAPEIEALNRSLGSPVTIREPVGHHEMPAVYKRHRWMVYTASSEINTVGWPLAVAEAQAAGVGVCIPDLRPDIADFVGPGAILYRSVDELRDIVAGPVPEALRERGFEQARKSDVRAHLHLLTDRWRPALRRRRARWPSGLRRRIARWLPGRPVPASGPR